MPLSAIKPSQYDRLLTEKIQGVRELLAPYSPPEPAIFPSEKTAYRMRAEFRVWHEGDNLDYVMFRRDDPKKPVPITQFPIASQTIQDLMPTLMVKLKTSSTLRQRLFQVEFLSTLSGEMLVTLVYHRKLDEQWETEAQTLAQDMAINLIGRSRKQKVVINSSYVTEVLTVFGTPFSFRQYEQAFTQPNAKVNTKMIEWACNCADGLKGDLLELYCGNGNFTLPLAGKFDQLIATELSKTSIRAARENLAANNIDNVEMIRLSAEEVTEAMAGKREFRRLATLPKALADYDLNSVFVDPPRAGLDEHTEKMVTGFESIIYISCNPESLATNLKTIHKTHSIEQFALFDQFPYTHHMESGVFLKRRKSL
jgi:tRNA (uracil-5-)-methyltransferase